LPMLHAGTLPHAACNCLFCYQRKCTPQFQPFIRASRKTLHPKTPHLSIMAWRLSVPIEPCVCDATPRRRTDQ
jgi:hypothetical protein